MTEGTETGQTRAPRGTQTREATARKRSWQRPEMLPSPEPAEGYQYRWVRVATLGTPDASNVSSKFREGWEPVKAKDHPEIEMSVVENNKFKDNIVIGGLILCKAPVEMVHERDEYFENQTQSQMAAVDNNLMRENDPRMPLFNDRKSKVTFGRGN